MANECFSLCIFQVNVDEDAKKETLCKQELHLSRATDERSFYRAWCSEAKAVREQLQINTLSKNEPCSREAAFHYSFDFAQQIHYPSNPFQPGPIYFKTPRKCGIFGIHAEAFPQQINYLLDEAVASGKWANVVISLLHHFLSFYGIGETDLRINADNCAGQNNIMLHYLCWRTIIGLHHSTYLHFLMAGHTKFSPDWCFGLFKQKFRKIFVSSLREIEQTVEGSTSESKINRSQLVGDQDGTVIVPMYAWDTLLGGYFKKFVGILEQHHFWFTNQQPGVLFYKGFTDSEEQSIKILKRDINPVDIDPEARPVEIVPAGFSDARKAYLFKEIRPFCKAEERDFVCPNPNSY
ncbi:uncharacterized protein LOC126825399 [Patella vulgata]|uniref:uncharacterized protein LOC126825399 n=1 Tax=Patella vulgata TaxID=6465 RepID=UPI0024A89BF1|nr:uncharacterized protein LOC126825399 [Patella vulgata]